jgi:hypothetical protein
MTTRYKPTRRALLAGAAAFPVLTMLKWPASAAEFELKYATGQDPSHPVNLRAQEALTRIREAPRAASTSSSFRLTSSAPTRTY